MLAFKLSVLEIIIIEQSWVGRGGGGWHLRDVWVELC